MGVVTAKRLLRESFIFSGELLRRDVAGPTSVPVIVEENMAFSTCPGPAGHFGPMTLRLRPPATSVPIMGLGATVGPVGTRVPMDLSAASPVLLANEFR